MDGMTSAINTASKGSLNDDGMEMFQNKKMELIDIVENIDDLDIKAQNIQITRN